MLKVNSIITDQNVTVNYLGQTHIVPRSDGLADKLILALKEERNEDIPDIVDAASRIKKFSHGTFVVRDGEILVNGIPAPPALGKKILTFSNEGLPYEPLVKFAEKLQQNPSFRAVNELFSFLEKNDHPITEEGNFIAYKRVREDFTDIHSGTFDNHPGCKPSVARNQVDEDCTRTCSSGLHVANWDYAHNKFASHNGTTDRMLEVEVNPADVVAVPVDYNNSKMRVCAYTVLSEIDSEHSSDTHLRYTGVTSAEDYKVTVDEDEDEESSYCDVCGEPTPAGTYVCDLCEEESSEDESDEDDAYPWNEELDV